MCVAAWENGVSSTTEFAHDCHRSLKAVQLQLPHLSVDHCPAAASPYLTTVAARAMHMQLPALGCLLVVRNVARS